LHLHLRLVSRRHVGPGHDGAASSVAALERLEAERVAPISAESIVVLHFYARDVTEQHARDAGQGSRGDWVAALCAPTARVEIVAADRHAVKWRRADRGVRGPAP